jgi:CheY-like chemotaxis protein
MSPQGITEETRATVMLVDDNDDLRVLLRVWLTQLNCRVVEAANGRTAVAVAASEHPDLIFMDLHMPKMDGFDAARRIRALANISEHVPIIAVSGDSALGAEARHPTSEAHDVGFTDFIPKPYSPRQLHDILDHYLPDTRRTTHV